MTESYSVWMFGPDPGDEELVFLLLREWRVGRLRGYHVEAAAQGGNEAATRDDRLYGDIGMATSFEQYLAVLIETGQLRRVGAVAPDELPGWARDDRVRSATPTAAG